MISGWKELLTQMKKKTSSENPDATSLSSQQAKPHAAQTSGQNPESEAELLKRLSVEWPRKAAAMLGIKTG